MNEKEQQPVFFGEKTPEGPSTRTKNVQYADQDFRPSPLAHSNASGHEHKRENKQPRQFREEEGTGQFSLPFQAHHAPGHHHGNTLRSDAYLRQALTSPYNQRTEKLGIASPNHCEVRKVTKETTLAYSPSLWREGMGQIHCSPHGDTSKGGPQEEVRQWAGEANPGLDAHQIFKTPHKSARRAMFSSPDRGRQDQAFTGNSSPCSAASGSSSSSSHHGSHQNPFEQGYDRLHFPVFSPNMFNMSQTPGSAEKETFQWNFEHLAELRPVHIDEKDIKRQMSRQWHDEEAEKRAQKAINYYFQHHMVAPSPWSEVPPPHVLPTTPCGPNYDDLLATPNEAQGSIQKDLPRSRKPVDKSCQTTLTLPLDIDLEKVLGEYMTYQDTAQDDSSNGRDSMSSSSLRRKLFFNADSSSVLSPVRSGRKSSDHLSAELSTPPNCKSTPQWERGSPVHTPSSRASWYSGSSMCAPLKPSSSDLEDSFHLPKTLCTDEVQFSSSPIRVRGPMSADRDYFRSSFSEYGPLSSPELSPIRDRQRGRSRQSLGFPAADGGQVDEEDLKFGSPARQQQQMEVHDGSSPQARPSPDVSPIAAFGSGGSGHHSRSHTLQADVSHFVFTSPQFASPEHYPHSQPSPSPIAASLFPKDSATPAQRTSISMDTDTTEFNPSADKEAGILSHRDSSMTEVTLGEGGTSSLDTDTLQHPSSASYPDMGYQTGSGNGSLQTTQEGGASMITDTPFSLTDTGTQLKSLTAKLNSGVGEQGCALGAPGDERKMDVGLALEESSVDGMGTSVDAGVMLHSNLTSQFMSLPLHSEFSVDSTDLDNSLHSLRQASEEAHKIGTLLRVLENKNLSKDSGVDNFSSRSRHFASRGQKASVSVDPPGYDSLQAQSVRGKAQLPQRHSPSQSEGDFSEDDDHALPQDSYIHRHDPDFLNKMGEYLERGGELSDEGDNKGGETVAPTCGSSRSVFRPVTFTGKGPDDSVLERAHQYLASVNYSEADGQGASMEPRATPASNSNLSSVLLKPSGLSTPTKRLLGRVADDLTAGREILGSPTLASDVAKEIIRRAELDLKRVQHVAHEKGSS